MRNKLKWCSFWERSNFPRIRFRDLKFRVWGLEIKHQKAQTSCDKGVFSFIIISQLLRPIELKFSQVCYFMHMLRYTNSVQCQRVPVCKEHVFRGGDADVLNAFCFTSNNQLSLCISSEIMHACLVRICLFWDHFGQTYSFY